MLIMQIYCKMASLMIYYHKKTRGRILSLTFNFLHSLILLSIFWEHQVLMIYVEPEPVKEQQSIFFKKDIKL